MISLIEWARLRYGSEGVRLVLLGYTMQQINAKLADYTVPEEARVVFANSTR